MDSPSAPPVCPVCGTVCPGQAIAVYTVERAASHFCPPWRNADRYVRFCAQIRRLWGTGEARILACPACGFTFGHPHVGGDEGFYSLMHQEMGYPAWRWDYDVALGHPLFQALQPGRAIDIGAGSGVFLHRLGRDGWETHAVESTQTTAALLRNRGITVHDDLTAAAGIAAGTFSLVTLFQVLEHVSGFDAMLRSCRELLRSDGVLFITVPDATAMRAQEEMTGWPDMPPNHINRWTPSSLTLALRHAGLTAGEPIREPARFHNVTQQLYHRVLADSMKPGTLAARAYRIRRKRWRAPVLGLLGAVALVKIARHGFRLAQGGAFALVATRRS